MILCLIIFVLSWFSPSSVNSLLCSWSENGLNDFISVWIAAGVFAPLIIALICRLRNRIHDLYAIIWKMPVKFIIHWPLTEEFAKITEFLDHVNGETDKFEAAFGDESESKKGLTKLQENLKLVDDSFLQMEIVVCSYSDQSVSCFEQRYQSLSELKIALAKHIKDNIEKGKKFLELRTHPTKLPIMKNSSLLEKVKKDIQIAVEKLQAYKQIEDEIRTKKSLKNATEDAIVSESACVGS